MDKRGNSTKILVIRLSALGDVAMTVPVLDTLLNTYPQLKITVLTKKAFMPIFEDMEGISLFEADVKGRHKRLMGLWRLYQELRPQRFEAVADLHNVLRSRILKKYYSLEGIPYLQIDKGRAEKQALTRAKNKEFKPLKTTHQRYADVFAQLGFPIELTMARPRPRMALGEKVLELVHQDTKKWLGVAPFAAHKGKMYPFELMERVLKKLNGTDKYKILLFGGGDTEIAQLEQWETAFGNAHCMAGKLGLREELQLISNLDAMLSMDSGNAHLAANYGIPVVTLWGVTHPYAGFYPFGQPMENALMADRNAFPLIPTSVYGNKLPKGYEGAMASIPPEAVVKKLEEILEA